MVEKPRRPAPSNLVDPVPLQKTILQPEIFDIP